MKKILVGAWVCVAACAPGLTAYLIAGMAAVLIPYLAALIVMLLWVIGDTMLKEPGREDWP